MEDLGEFDNTLVLWIWGDNGASMEGTVTGSFNELTMHNGIPLTDERQLQLSERNGGLDEWGGPIMDPHYSTAWPGRETPRSSEASRSALASGGTRNPLAVHWPDHIAAKGGARTQFTDVIDLAPTILSTKMPCPTPSTASTRSRCTVPASSRH